MRIVAVPAALALLFAVGQAAQADPGPSAKDLARGRQQVADKAAQVGRVKAQLAEANGELDRLSTQAEVAVERYNGQLVRLARAQQAYAAAQQKLAQAEAQYQQARSDLATFAAEAYRISTGMDSLTMAVAGTGGPQGAMDRASMIQVLADRQAGAVQRVHGTKEVADLFRRQARRALNLQQEATDQAAQAKAAAEQAAAEQRSAVQRIQARTAQLQRQLSQAEQHAADLQRRREAALEQAREAAAAKAAEKEAEQAKPQGGRASVALMRGAGRGGVAVRAALSRLGTPYSWGGGTEAGPSYGIAQGADIKGFDCSGLMLYAWAKAGVRLDHWTGTQWTSGPHIPTDLLMPGDLVFFATDTSDPDTIHHVGMYIGHGEMVEAPYTGARVRISSIWRHDLIGATRPL